MGEMLPTRDVQIRPLGLVTVELTATGAGLTASAFGRKLINTARLLHVTEEVMGRTPLGRGKRKLEWLVWDLYCEGHTLSFTLLPVFKADRDAWLKKHRAAKKREAKP
jgi:hypothetical protein